MKTKTDNLEKRMSQIESTLDEIKSFLASKCVKSKKNGQEAFLSEGLQLKIEDIMRHFEFGKVHRVMETLDWRWATVKRGMEIPSIEDIKAEARRLLVDACTEKQTIATGGLRANYENGTVDDPTPYLSLEFIVTDWEGDETEEEDDEEGDDGDWVE